MVAVFGGFIFWEAALVRSIGFGPAFGVLLDAFVVRLLLMPALMHLLGKSVWRLPRWLDRILPHVDIEGSRLNNRPRGRSAVDDTAMTARESTRIPPRR
ncbi:putative membrane protein YdfJ with MMPL/SSD domain [Promicromonospora iranensis]|uniref:Membrane protein YdfJ with MMPL/SSD domain n=1 Tax=Promicromonospora iranensis TaxID=1105144 RepID=A0ABU2CWT9_9MICO|nr:putative membrane protein YdfJ with MMPL/SSD domain [Promicromonospora iranensis]